jgi:hypothetical protein
MNLRFYRIWYNAAQKGITLTAAMAFEPINQDWEKKWQEEWKKVAPDRALTSAMARENALSRPYSTYLASALVTDFAADHTEWCDEVLTAISKLELGLITTYVWDGQGFQHQMTSSKVTFEHTIFGECPEWPLWSCTLAQYKAALQGWRKFIDMPQSIDTELIVELPDDTL